MTFSCPLWQTAIFIFPVVAGKRLVQRFECARQELAYWSRSELPRRLYCKVLPRQMVEFAVWWGGSGFQKQSIAVGRKEPTPFHTYLGVRWRRVAADLQGPGRLQMDRSRSSTFELGWQLTVALPVETAQTLPRAAFTMHSRVPQG